MIKMKCKKNEDNFINKFIVDKLMAVRGVKGQVTIFVIIAILIVAALIIFFAVSDSGRKIITGFTDTGNFDVKGSIENCIDENKNIESSITAILEQGGSLKPELNYLFEDKNLSYLCYTNEFYDTCVNQQPLLIQHVEKEIYSAINGEVENCIKSTNEELTKRSY